MTQTIGKALVLEKCQEALATVAMDAGEGYKVVAGFQMVSVCQSGES